MKKKFNEWYTSQVQQLGEGKEVEQIEVKLTLTTLKPIHAKWRVDFYNHMTITERKKVISNDWSATGITNSVINPLVSESSVKQDDICRPKMKTILAT